MRLHVLPNFILILISTYDQREHQPSARGGYHCSVMSCACRCACTPVRYTCNHKPTLTVHCVVTDGVFWGTGARVQRLKCTHCYDCIDLNNQSCLLKKAVLLRKHMACWSGMAPGITTLTNMDK